MNKSIARIGAIIVIITVALFALCMVISKFRFVSLRSP